MIIDIIEMPFLGKSLPEYGSFIPVSIPHPQNLDDIYMIGFKTHANIHKHYKRYKIIESLGGMILEHIVLAAQELDLLSGKKRSYGSTRINYTNVYVITTRQHIGNKITTHRYFKPLEHLLMALGSNASGIKTIHQVAISALLNMSERVYKLDELTHILNDFVFENEGVLTHLTTPSVNDVVDIMANIHNIFNDVFH